MWLAMKALVYRCCTYLSSINLTHVLHVRNGFYLTHVLHVRNVRNARCFLNTPLLKAQVSTHEWPNTPKL